jgi:hypothetical protein
MPIFYTLIARDGHILTEATSRTVEAGNFQQIALQILSKIGQESEGAKRSFSTGGYAFHLILLHLANLIFPFKCTNAHHFLGSYVFNIQINDGVVYLCLVDLSTPLSFLFLFLFG